MSKRMCIAALVCANLLLLTGVVLVTTTPNAAYAQDTGLNYNYLIVTAEVTTGNDAVFLLDVRRRLLHVFYNDRGARGLTELRLVGSRNLDRDFRNLEERR